MSTPGVYLQIGFFFLIMGVRINLYASQLIFQDFKVNDQVSLQ